MILVTSTCIYHIYSEDLDLFTKNVSISDPLRIAAVLLGNIALSILSQSPIPSSYLNSLRWDIGKYYKNLLMLLFDVLQST